MDEAGLTEKPGISENPPQEEESESKYLKRMMLLRCMIEIMSSFVPLPVLTPIIQEHHSKDTQHGQRMHHKKEVR